jgi:uncharacterized membrane protein YqhA
LRHSISGYENKVAVSIVAISSIHLLRIFMNAHASHRKA